MLEAIKQPTDMLEYLVRSVLFELLFLLCSFFLPNRSIRSSCLIPFFWIGIELYLLRKQANYEISPLMVIHREERQSFAHFLTSTCAIVGGVLTVASLIDGFVVCQILPPPPSRGLNLLLRFAHILT